MRGRARVAGLANERVLPAIGFQEIKWWAAEERRAASFRPIKPAVFGYLGCHFLSENACTCIKKAIFLWLAPKRRSRKAFFAGGGAREKGRFFKRKSQPSKKCYNGKCSKTIKNAFLEA